MQKSTVLTGTQNERVRVVNRPGFYSALQTEHVLSNTGLFEPLKDKISTWTVDLTNPAGEYTEQELSYAAANAEAFLQNLLKGKMTEELFQVVSKNRNFIQANGT